MRIVKLSDVVSVCGSSLLALSVLAIAFACSKEQIVKTVTAVDAIAKEVCGQGDPLLTCLDKIEKSDRVVTARRARMMSPGDAGE